MISTNSIILSICLCLTIGSFIVTVESCRADWDNQCNTNQECCSGFCYRGNPNWATGVCKPNNNGPPPSNVPQSGKQRGSGECSWYGADGEIPPGSYTSCGDIFDRNAMKAGQLPGLSPRLPCGTRVRITNDANGRTVDVVINDSGTRADRILDLTYAAFGQIEDRDKGVTRCSYVVL